MASTVSIEFEDVYYDLGEVESTAREFEDVARIRIVRGPGRATITITAEQEVLARISGALANMSLARTIEVRS
jgi:hypothetical protein